MSDFKVAGTVIFVISDGSGTGGTPVIQVEEFLDGFRRECMPHRGERRGNAALWAAAKRGSGALRRLFHQAVFVVFDHFGQAFAAVYRGGPA